MRTTLVAGGLLLSPLMLGPTQAGSAPDLKNAVRAIHESAIINGDWDHNHQAPLGPSPLGQSGPRPRLQLQLAVAPSDPCWWRRYEECLYY